MSWIIAAVIILVVLAITSLVIHKFFPKYRKWEPLMLIVELLSFVFMFID